MWGHLKDENDKFSVLKNVVCYLLLFSFRCLFSYFVL